MKRIAVCFLFWAIGGNVFGAGKSFLVDESFPVVVVPSLFSTQPGSGDTIFVSSLRTQSLIFSGFKGGATQPLVVINKGGQVNINAPQSFSALQFKNCRYLKISGKGVAGITYGFKLSAGSCGVSFNTSTSDCEIEAVEINHEGFFGIVAKDDYHGNPPNPVPVFENLAIHDCLIENVTEGMYLGETTTPGMEFRHVRVYNNITCNTGREGIQIANMPDDVEVYNNIVYNAGADQEYAQGNGIQVGDNSVARVYRNIIAGAYENGFVVFGSGDIYISENYIEDTRGIFIDNRKVTNELAPIVVENNYFCSLTDGVAITNYNEMNPVDVLNNRWDGQALLTSELVAGTTKLTVGGNINGSVPPLGFMGPQQGNFEQMGSNAAVYKTMGPQPGLKHSFNYTPQLDSVPDTYISSGSDSVIVFKALTDDNDKVTFSISETPSYATFTDNGNNTGTLRLLPKENNIGKSEVLVTVTDSSNKAKARQSFLLSVTPRNNNSPELSISGTIGAKTLSKTTIPVKYFDPDGDPVSVYAENLPGFAQMLKRDTCYFLVLNTKYADSGTYTGIVVYADDGYNPPVSKKVEINVEANTLKDGMPVFRVNCGGPELNDSELNWESDYYVKLPYEVSDDCVTGSHSWKGTNSTSAPDSLFGPWGYAKTDEWMEWLFPCENGSYWVNLYFSENRNYIESVGPSIFNIYLNNRQVATNFSIYGEAGYAALEKSFLVKADSGQILLQLEPVQNTPKLNGVEVVYCSPSKTLKEKNNYKLFPNPVTEWFILSSEDSTLYGNYRFSVVDYKGYTVKSFHSEAARSNKMLVQIGEYSIEPGFYLLKVTNQLGYTESLPIVVGK